MSSYDVIVLGAGFAGLTAARELSHRGLSVAVLEARDRIGGRTWLAERLGMDLELGGGWVHWVQPYVWAELGRYGLGVTPSPKPANAYWWTGSETVSGTPETLLDLLDRPNQLLVAEARDVFAQPFAPLSASRMNRLDGISLRERIGGLPLSPEQRTLLESFWTLNFNGSIDDAAYTQALRWVALTNGDWRANFEACATYKVAGGTQALATAIASDGDAEIIFDTDVTALETNTDGVRATCGGGRVFLANRAIVTVPVHALGRIRFAPELSPVRRDAIARGHLGRGTKTWFTLEGERAPFVALGAADWLLNFFATEYVRDGQTYVIGFGPDAHAGDLTDPAAVEEILRRLVPDARVIATAGHDWVRDPYAQGTWPMHRAGFLASHLAAMQAPHGRIHFAGSDIANGWGGFIDGAIESGLHAARVVLESSAPSVPATVPRNRPRQLIRASTDSSATPVTAAH